MSHGEGLGQRHGAAAAELGLLYFSLDKSLHVAAWEGAVTLKVKAAQSCLTLCHPMGFSGPEYWRGWPFPSPGDLPNPGIKSRSPTLQADSLPAELPGQLGKANSFS